jgi:hypothetical protein
MGVLLRVDDRRRAAPGMRPGAFGVGAMELGAIRAVLTPEQHVTFDPIARVWLREQARQGYRVTVPGIPLVP